MRYTTRAIVIARSPYSESSQVVRFLTERAGFVSALARGSHRPKSAYGGPIDLLTCGRADLSSRRGSELEALHSFIVERPWRGLRRRLETWLAASHVLELVRPFAWPKDRALDVFDLTYASLEFLDTAPSPDAIEAGLAYHGARLLGLAGFTPQLTNCCVCGRNQEADHVERRVRFSARLGGSICETCVSRDPDAQKCASGTLDLIARLLGSGGATAPATARFTKEARSILDRFTEERLEQKLLAGRWVADGVPSFRRSRS